MLKSEKIEYIELLEERLRRKKERVVFAQWETLYQWQKQFVGATAKSRSCCLMAANRVGKTRTGLLIDAMHLLGEYPGDWNGHRFERPPLIWLLGVTGEKTRDLLQTPLFGRLEGGEFTGGLIPKEKILSYRSMTGTSGAVREVRVKHATGEATVQFWSYSQGQAVLMGDSLDFYHIDEEPKDQTIFPQVLTRTATGDKGRGGRGILTFTPENGRTELVVQFMDNPTDSQFFMQKGWDDAPHLTEETKESLLSQYPAHQRDMRTKGVPMLGHGRIYDFSEDFITCEPFEIPNHYRVIDGMDFGFDHPQARVRIALDLDNDMIYVTHAWKQSQCTPDQAWGATKAWASNCPTAWPHDGLNREKSSGEQQKKYYSDAGFRMLPERATWPDGSNSVEPGIFELRDLLAKGKLKVFSGCRAVLDEMLQYHRDDKGKIVKTQDDALDALRYAYMMRRYAKAHGEITTATRSRAVIPRPLRTIGGR